jgi:hypothetical protein
MVVVQKALCGAYITSRLGIKKFLWVTSIAASGQEHIRSGNADFYNISFSQTSGIFSIGRTQDIIPGSKGKDSIRSNLQESGERRLDDTLPCFWL